MYETFIAWEIIASIVNVKLQGQKDRVDGIKIINLQMQITPASSK